MNANSVPATGRQRATVASHAFVHIPFFVDAAILSGIDGRMGADGYEELEVPGDGSCLFHAVLTAYFAEKKARLPVYADPRRLHETSLKLRERAVHHVLRHYDKPLGDGFDTGKDLIMLEYGSSEGDPLGPPIRDPVQYLKHMRHPTTFAGNTEIVALSQILRSTITVVQAGVPDQAYRFPRPEATIRVRFDPSSRHYTPLVRHVK